MSTTRKIAIITGGTNGLGLATGKRLARAGYHVILTARNPELGQRAVAQVLADGGDSAEALPLDLSSLDSVRRFAAEFLRRQSPLHLLINSAGQKVDHLDMSADGFELTLATNHIGHFLLTNLLLQRLRQSAPARIVVVSSQTHIPADWNNPPPDFAFDNLKGERYYSEEVFYKNSKLANMWFTYELHRRLAGSGVTCNAVCPGFVPETLARHEKGFLRQLLYRRILPLLPYARSLAQAADMYLYVATDPALEGVSGKFFVDKKQIQSSPDSYDEDKARRLWELSEGWCGLNEQPSNGAQGKPALPPQWPRS